MGNLISVFEMKTVTITLDSLHILLTLAIYITLIIFIWITRIDPCGDKMLCDNVNDRRGSDTDIPRCVSGPAGSHA